jgi:hypothetical protein
MSSSDPSPAASSSSTPSAVQGPVVGDASGATPSSAVELAAAVLAARRSEAAVCGRFMVTGSMDATAPFPAPPPAAPLANMSPPAGLPAGSTLNDVATSAPPLEPLAVLHAAALARRGSGPALGGRMGGFGKSRMAHPAASCPPDGQLQRDTAVVVEGLGSLSLLAAQGEVPEALSAPELAVLPMPVQHARSASSAAAVLAARKSDPAVGGLLEAPAKPCGGLSAAATAAFGDEEGWVQVGRGSCLDREPSSLLRHEGLERSLAFKRWARGRCFRCL